MTDGDGVTTLVAFHGCPLRCRYCLNPQSLVSPERHGVYTAEQLYEATKIDELYFQVAELLSVAENRLCIRSL